MQTTNPQDHIQALKGVINDAGGDKQLLQSKILEYIDSQLRDRIQTTQGQISFIVANNVDLAELLGQPSAKELIHYCSVLHLVYMRYCDKGQLLDACLGLMESGQTFQQLQYIEQKSVRFATFYLLYELAPAQLSTYRDDCQGTAEHELLLQTLLALHGSVVGTAPAYDTGKQHMVTQFIDYVAPSPGQLSGLGRFYVDNRTVLAWLLHHSDQRQLPLNLIATAHEGDADLLGLIHTDAMLCAVKSFGGVELERLLATRLAAQCRRIIAEYHYATGGILRDLLQLDDHAFIGVAKSLPADALKEYRLLHCFRSRVDACESDPQTVHADIHLRHLPSVQDGYERFAIAVIFQHHANELGEDQSILTLAFNETDQLVLRIRDSRLQIWENTDQVTAAEKIERNTAYDLCLQIVQDNFSVNKEHYVFVYTGTNMALKSTIRSFKPGALRSITFTGLVSGQEVIVARQALSYQSIQLLMRRARGESIRVRHPVFNTTVANILTFQIDSLLDGIILKGDPELPSKVAQHVCIGVKCDGKNYQSVCFYSQLNSLLNKEPYAARCLRLAQGEYSQNGLSQYIVTAFNKRVKVCEVVQEMIDYYCCHEIDYSSLNILGGPFKQPQTPHFVVEKFTSRPVQLAAPAEDDTTKKVVYNATNTRDILAEYEECAIARRYEAMLAMQLHHHGFIYQCFSEIEEYNNTELRQLTMFILTSGINLNVDEKLLSLMTYQYSDKIRQKKNAYNEFYCIKMIIRLLIQQYGMDQGGRAGTSEDSQQDQLSALLQDVKVADTNVQIITALEQVLPMYNQLDYTQVTEIAQVVEYQEVHSDIMSLLLQNSKERAEDYTSILGGQYLRNVSHAMCQKQCLRCVDPTTSLAVLEYFMENEVADPHSLYVNVTSAMMYYQNNIEKQRIGPESTLGRLFPFVLNKKVHTLTAIVCSILYNILQNDSNEGVATKLFAFYLQTTKFQYIGQALKLDYPNQDRLFTFLLDAMCSIMSEKYREYQQKQAHILQSLLVDKKDIAVLKETILEILYQKQPTCYNIYLFMLDAVVEKEQHKVALAKCMLHAMTCRLLSGDSSDMSTVCSYIENNRQLWEDHVTKARFHGPGPAKISAKDAAYAAMLLVCMRHFKSTGILVKLRPLLVKQLICLAQIISDQKTVQTITNTFMQNDYEIIMGQLSQQQWQQIKDVAKECCPESQPLRQTVRGSAPRCPDTDFEIESTDYVGLYVRKQVAMYKFRPVVDQYYRQREQRQLALTEILFSNMSVVNQVQYSRLSMRLTRNRQQYYSQILIPKHALDLALCQEIGIRTSDQVYCSSLIQRSQYIMAFPAKRSIQSSLAQERGVVILTNRSIVYVSNCSIAQERSHSFKHQWQNDTFSDITGDRLNSGVSAELKARGRTYILASSYMNYLHDPGLCLTDESQILTVQGAMVHAINAQVCNHRHSGMELILKNGYVLGLEVCDVFSDRRFAHGGGCHGDNTGAELVRGLALYVVQKQLGVTVNAPFLCTAGLARVRFRSQIYSIGEQYLLEPKLAVTPDLRQLLNASLRKGVDEYTKTYSRYMIGLLRDQGAVEVHRVGRLNFELFEDEAFTLCSEYCGAYQENIVSMANGLCYLYMGDLISAQQFVLYINLLCSRTPSSLQQSSIFPVVKGRNMTRPVQAQLRERYQLLREKLEQYNISTMQHRSALEVFNQHYFQNGTFTSTSASTLYYTFRQQPYTSALIDLQGNKFDSPDRMFHSYSGLYDQIFRNNYKEHIHQFYYSIKLYMNLYGFLIGERHNGAPIGDLHLQIEPDDEPVAQVVQQQALQCDAPCSVVIQEGPDPCDSIIKMETAIEEANEESDDPEMENYGHEDETNAGRDIPLNYLALMAEFNQQLESAHKLRLVNWLQLFFGSKTNCPRLCNSYNNSVYYFVHTHETNLLGEIDKMQFFGTLNTIACQQYGRTVAQRKYASYASQARLSSVQELHRQFAQFNSGRELVQIEHITAPSNGTVESFPCPIVLKRIRIQVMRALQKQHPPVISFQLPSDRQTLMSMYLRDYMALHNGCRCNISGNILAVQDPRGMRLCTRVFKKQTIRAGVIPSTQSVCILFANEIRVLQVRVTECVSACVHDVFAIPTPPILASHLNHDTAVLSLITAIDEGSQYLYYQFDVLNGQVLYVGPAPLVGGPEDVQIKQTAAGFTVVRSNNWVTILTNENIQVCQQDVGELVGIQAGQRFRLHTFSEFYERSFLLVYCANKLYTIGFDMERLKDTRVQERQATRMTCPQAQDGYVLYGCNCELLNSERMLNNVVQQRLLRYGDFRLRVNERITFKHEIRSVWCGNRVVQNSYYQNNGNSIVYVRLGTGDIATVLVTGRTNGSAQ